MDAQKYWLLSLIISVIIIATAFPNNFFSFLAYTLLIPYAFLLSVKKYGLKKSTKFLLTAVVLSYAFEFLGVHYGFPFGKYIYTSNLGYKIFGIPLLIPFMWFSFIAVSYMTFNSLFLSAVFTMLIDVVMDPLLSGRAWIWLTTLDNFYYGVPLSNFVGWFLVSFTILFLTFGTKRGDARDLGSWMTYVSLVLSLSIIAFVREIVVAGMIGLGIVIVVLLYRRKNKRKRKRKL